MAIRTDLAQEAHALAQEAGRTSALPGVEARSWSEAGTALTLVKVLSQEGERAIGKPRGSFLSLALDAVRRGDRTAWEQAQRLLCRKLEELPKAARAYVDYLEQSVNCPIRYISVGADRDAYIEK